MWWIVVSSTYITTSLSTSYDNVEMLSKQQQSTAAYDNVEISPTIQ